MDERKSKNVHRLWTPNKKSDRLEREQESALEVVFWGERSKKISIWRIVQGPTVCTALRYPEARPKHRLDHLKTFIAFNIAETWRISEQFIRFVLNKKYCNRPVLWNLYNSLYYDKLKNFFYAFTNGLANYLW